MEKQAQNTKRMAYAMLAVNRYAQRPEIIPARQWSAVKSAMERRFTREFMDTPDGLYTDAQIWKQTFRQHIEQALLDYAINEIDSDTVAGILNVDADDIKGTLADFYQEWDEADEPEDSDAVIDKYVDIFTFTGEPQDIELTKHNS